MNTNRRVTLRTMPQPAELNVNGNVFGGWVLSQMDLAGGDTAARRAKGPVATIAIEAMTFLCPINVGDVVSVYTEISKVGRTSITVAVEVYAERGATRQELKVTQGI
ncbi:MAG: acyl-CoA thioesterase, partial [Kordiimonadaceae bacterium]|nr:acyl-CoA thioesterase [Kordiimonadaceae bacterium]